MTDDKVIEVACRKVAAIKMNLVNDPEGIRLPNDLWQQFMPHMRAALAAADKVRAEGFAFATEAQRIIDLIRQNALFVSDVDAVLRRAFAAGLAKGEADRVAWAVERWKAEIENRPLQNIHRRTLDDTWRQVIRHFGGDDVALCGPAHDDLAPSEAPNVERETLDIQTQAERSPSVSDNFSTDEIAWIELVEKDDRTSPAEYPDHALITREEFFSALDAARAEGVAAERERIAKWFEAKWTEESGPDWGLASQGARQRWSDYNRRVLSYASAIRETKPC